MRVRSPLLISVSLTASLLIHAAAGASEVVLITPEEASLPPAAETSLGDRGLTRGPGVVQIIPAADDKVPPPLPLRIGLTPRNGVPIDTSSVRITYLKRPNVDLTGRIKPFITGEGIQIDRARVPSGVHVLRIDLKDARGRAGAALVRLAAE